MKLEAIKDKVLSDSAAAPQELSTELLNIVSGGMDPPTNADGDGRFANASWTMGF
jgi:hypothetical protein